MEDIYICLCCLTPIIFRYKPPRVYHIIPGAGWDCWHENGACRAGVLKVLWTTLDADAKRSRRRAEALHEALLKNPRRSRTNERGLLRYVDDQLGRGRLDVMCDFLISLAAKGDPASVRLSRAITTSEGWHEQVARLRTASEAAGR